jgi:hypothetical protein
MLASLKHSRRKRYQWLILLLGALSSAAFAHNGPPFPIIVDREIGPCMVSLWTHPDIGIGTFWVMVDPPTGGSIPGDLKVRVGIQPVSGRIAEVIYPAERDDQRGQVQYKVLAPFDRQEFVRARVLLESSRGGGEAAAEVEVTPVGLGRWDLLVYALPFAGAGFLWFRAIARRHGSRAKHVQRS